MKSLLIVSGLLAASLNSAVAAPVTLDFEGLANASFPLSTYGNTVVEDGFVLSTNASFGGFATWAPGTIHYTGSNALFGNTVGSTTVLTQQNSDPFSIASMGITFTNGGINPVAEFDLTFFGTKVGSGTVQQTFTIGPGFNPSLQTILFSGAFSGLASLSWTHPSQTFQFDNVVVDGAAASVAAPAAFALLGFGLFGLATRRRTI